VVAYNLTTAADGVRNTEDGSERISRNNKRKNDKSKNKEKNGKKERK
jgi:hypothetical protein